MMSYPTNDEIDAAYARAMAERDRFAAAIARVAVLETSDLNCDAQIQAAIARGDSAWSLFHAGAQAMLLRVHAALREVDRG